MSCSALILVAAGSSTRIGIDKNGEKIKKEYLPFKNETVLSYTANTFIKVLSPKIVVVTYPFDADLLEMKKHQENCKAALFANEAVKNADCQFVFVPGGNTRQDSVYYALEQIDKKMPKEDNPIVFIHDGARPFVNPETIALVNRAAQEFGAAAPGLKPVDTQKEIDENGFIKTHLKRDNIISIQTPQAFNFRQLFEAYKAEGDLAHYTDDTEIWDEFVTAHRRTINLSHVKIVMGDPNNKKITYKNDLVLLND